MVTNDELRELFTGLPTGVKLTVISDSCFSGTVTHRIPGEDQRMRFLDPDLRGYKAVSNPLRYKRKKAEKFPESGMKEILISATNDIEFAYDDKFDDVYHGALSYYALQTIRNADYKITYAELVKKINQQLTKAHYPQHPQLEGKQENKEGQIFT